MKRILILAALVLSLLAGTAWAATAPQTLTAVVAQTNADTASVALVFPNSQQNILIRNITFWYDNAANTNPIYVGIIQATAAHTRELWLGEAMVSSGIVTKQYLEINRVMTAATAQAGLRVFVSAASSDSLMAIVEYELIAK